MELIGRDAELDDLVARVDRHRLVTVIGPGGIGKTTLARAGADVAAREFRHGTDFVDLSRVSAAADVEHAIAGQLGFPSFAVLLESARDRAALIVVDNCEHVLDAAAGAVGDVLDAVPRTTVVCTSRSPLDLPDESLVVLGPLALPQPGSASPDGAAVRLFTSRAGAVGAPVDQTDLEQVGELCRQLDGVPLAIDIAAARSRSMSVGEMLERFDEHLTLLARPRYRGAPRHRSVASTIEWSYDLLNEDDQAFFDRLGVFDGPFTAPMAHAVAQDPDLDADRTRLQLDDLVDASLLLVDTSAPSTWYRMLVVVRAVAAEHLARRGEHDSTHDRFVDHAVTLAVDSIDASRVTWRVGTIEALLAQYENLAAATRWCLDHDATGDRALVLVTAMWDVANLAHTSEIEALGAEVLDRWPDRANPRWADAAGTVATARSRLGRLDDALLLVDSALPIADDRAEFAPVTLRRVRAQLLLAGGDAEAAFEWFSEAASVARGRSLLALANESEVFRAALLAFRGDVHDARELVHAAIADAVAAESDYGAIWARTVAGYVELHIDQQAAVAVIERCLSDARSIGYSAGIYSALRLASLAALATGDVAGAAARSGELLDRVATGVAFDDVHSSLYVAGVVLHGLSRGLDDPDRRSRVAAVAADLVATVRALPGVSLLVAPSRREIVPTPDDSGVALTIRDAAVLARATLHELLDDGVSWASGRVEGESTAHGDEFVFARVGEMWDLCFEGRRAMVRSSKGVEDIARILIAQGTEVGCLDLMGSAVIEPGTGDLIDGTARREYEDRIRELQQDIDDADADNDLARAERATIELDLLVEQLAGATGLSGASRSTGGSVERARSAVTQRIRSAIRRIDDVLPPLGRHLAVSITTGVYCAYRPERPTDWTVRTD